MRVIDLIYPRGSIRDFGRIALVCVIGALMAGAYGVVHDQITYSIGPEYFTRFKFYQFSYAEPSGGSPRLFAAVIGFLATWWVGALMAWVMGRVSLMRGRELPAMRDFMLAFAITFLVSFLVACGGFLYGLWRKRTGYASGWIEWMDALAIEDQGAFMTVGYIHNSSYLGGVVGTIVAIIFLRSKSGSRNHN